MDEVVLHISNPNLKVSARRSIKVLQQKPILSWPLGRRVFVVETQVPIIQEKQISYASKVSFQSFPEDANKMHSNSEVEDLDVLLFLQYLLNAIPTRSVIL